jgi:hypothetical protein
VKRYLSDRCSWGRRWRWRRRRRRRRRSLKLRF